MERFEHVISSALFTRTLIVLQSLWLMASGIAWSLDDHYLFGLTALDIRPALSVCIIGVGYALFPRTLAWLGYIWCLVVGLACVGRWFTVLLGNYEPGYTITALGWVIQFGAAIVFTTQVQASQVLRRD